MGIKNSPEKSQRAVDNNGEFIHQGTYFEILNLVIVIKINDYFLIQFRIDQEIFYIENHFYHYYFC